LIPKYTITVVEGTRPIDTAVTKFGGQPVWLHTPTWPLSRSTGAPMMFVAQVALDPALFGDIPGRRAYLFMTAWADGTYDFNLGENAVIVQPTSVLADVETRLQARGPTLFRFSPSRPGEWGERIACEYSALLAPGVDSDTLPEYGEWLKEDSTTEEQAHNKVGGAPGFLQAAETPGSGWRLLLQLDSTTLPFELNFGDGGIGYAFLSPDGVRGKFMWQSL